MLAPKLRYARPLTASPCGARPNDAVSYVIGWAKISSLLESVQGLHFRIADVLVKKHGTLAFLG